MANYKHAKWQKSVRSAAVLTPQHGCDFDLHEKKYVLYTWGMIKNVRNLLNSVNLINAKLCTTVLISELNCILRSEWFQ